jgi:small-conductance mechanosensitive channel
MLTVGAVATVLLSFITLYLVSLWVKRLITRRLLTRTSLDLGAREAIGSLFRYFVLFLGSIVIIQSAGIDLTALNVLAGAIGVGIGFGRAVLRGDGGLGEGDGACRLGVVPLQRVQMRQQQPA